MGGYLSLLLWAMEKIKQSTSPCGFRIHLKHYTTPPHERIWHRCLEALQLLRDTRRKAHKTVDAGNRPRKRYCVFGFEPRRPNCVYYSLFFIHDEKNTHTSENLHRDTHRWPMTRPNYRVYTYIIRDYMRISSSHNLFFSITLSLSLYFFCLSLSSSLFMWSLWITRSLTPLHFEFGVLCTVSPVILRAFGCCRDRHNCARRSLRRARKRGEFWGLAKSGGPG